LISIDTCRADYIGCYNPDRKITPNIDGLAQQATLFENARTTVPITLPAHCSMLTGLIPPTHGVRAQPGFKLPPSRLTLASVLQAGRYSTGAIVSSFTLNDAMGLKNGFDTYDDVFREPVGGRTDERAGEEVSDAAIEWLATHKDDEKFFLFVHYYDPHLPYEAPSRFARRFGPDSHDQYAAEIAYTDYCIGRVFDELKRLGLYDDSLIIVTADHGEMLGEHGEAGHQYFVYESAIRVPLLIKLPGQRKSNRVVELAGLIDIVPTVYSLVGVQGAPPVDGIDLTPRLLGKVPSSASSQRRLYAESIVPYFYGANPLFTQADLKWKYIASTRPELYDLLSDPGETTNLLEAGGGIDPQQRTAHVGQARLMEDQIKKILAKTHGVDLSESRVAPSDETIRRLASLGYVGFSDEGAFQFERTRKDAKDAVHLYSDCEEAMRLYVSGQKEQALSILETVVVECPHLTTAKALLTRIRRQLGQFEHE
jgi:arylsulfatase A-like enzyme